MAQNAIALYATNHQSMHTLYCYPQSVVVLSVLHFSKFILHESQKYMTKMTYIS